MAEQDRKRAALVTGGSNGIGAAVVRRLAGEGVAVAFTYASSAERAEALVAEVTAAGGTVLAIRADNAKDGEVEAAVAHTVAAFGGLDILVNNAGRIMGDTLEQLTMADFDTMVAINVRAVFAAIKAASPHMGEGGRIVTIGSIVASHVGRAGLVLYALTKASLQGMVQALAHDFGPRGITINNVVPGPTVTGINPADGPHAARLASLIPRGRMGDPAEVAGLIGYLVSAEASYTNGASIVIDGGLTA